MGSLLWALEPGILIYLIYIYIYVYIYIYPTSTLYSPLKGLRAHYIYIYTRTSIHT